MVQPKAVSLAGTPMHFPFMLHVHTRTNYDNVSGLFMENNEEHRGQNCGIGVEYKEIFHNCMRDCLCVPTKQQQQQQEARFHFNEDIE